MIVGSDKFNRKLSWGDICKFKINNVEYEGMIDYDMSYFAYTFEMKDDKFPSVLMSKADHQSIEKIINVYSTDVNDKTYEFYRQLVNNQ